jgi:hypothetical protein
MRLEIDEGLEERKEVKEIEGIKDVLLFEFFDSPDCLDC